ncbi:Capsular polysaccharide phosphotransferase SacB [uncultured Avibacterium sp.]|uniref:Capsular polysaccharide phosphotransferase SacB n=3 Tax=Avibacterium TaxID=292486 RepID=A0A486XGV6_9PAST|nr:Capsular polysaccharide phosphotransferase SacB [uncultured Avibacterium sp.]
MNNNNLDKIDFVLPWVDPSDELWQEKKEHFSNERNVDLGSNTSARYRDMEILKYVLRSIEKNCSWYNNIFLITEGHYPKWLNIKHHKIRLISHEELFYDKEDLPTFNSNSIECNLSSLKSLGLTEKFIYLNDDMLIFRKVDSSRFFINNLPVDFLCHTLIPRSKFLLKLLGISDSWNYALLNDIALVNSKKNIHTISKYLIYHANYSITEKLNNFLMKNLYRKAISLKHWHHPQPYLINTLEKVREIFKLQLERASKNKFRDKTDLTPYLYRYWHLLSGEFYPAKFNDGIGDKNITSVKDVNEIFEKLKKEPHINFVCFNDSPDLTEQQFSLVKEKLLNELEKYFPEKASFEI